MTEEAKKRKAEIKAFNDEMKRKAAEKKAQQEKEQSLEEYRDPVAYDAENAQNSSFMVDGPFYLSLAQQVGGTVLELGCGTGRITIPMAQAGIEMTGLDVVPQMLERARQKAGELSIRWVEGDVRTFQLEQSFNLICATGGVFNMLLTRADQEAMLQQVRKHLTPDGLFAIDVVVPQADWMVSHPEETHWDTYDTEDGRTIQLSGTEHYDPIRQIKHEVAYRRWTQPDGQPVTKISTFRFRYIFPQEMEALLHYNGYSIQNRYADGWFEPPNATSKNIFYVCKKTR